MSSARLNRGTPTGGAGLVKDNAAQAARAKQAAAKAKGLKIKQIQEQALANLSQRQLYIVLYIRTAPPSANDFHWGFYYHRNEEAGGTKYHITNMSSSWITDHGTTGGLFKSLFLCVVIKIANVPAEKEQQLDQVMRSYDGNLNGIPNVTCRVWVMTIMAMLVQHGLVVCSDLPGLQTECLNFGNQHMGSAYQNNQPRPVVISTKCL